MKYIIALALLILVASPAPAALNAIEKKVQQSPQMTRECARKINYYEGKIEKYNAIQNKKTIHKIKLGFFVAELQNWKDYCSGDQGDFELF